MPLLESVVKVRDSAKTTGGAYLNPSSIEKDSTVRITLLGDKSPGYELGHDGKRFSMKFQRLSHKIFRPALKKKVLSKQKPKGFYGSRKNDV